MMPIEKAFLENFAQKGYSKLHPGVKPQTDPIINTLSEVMSLQMGGTVYSDIASVTRLDHAETTKKNLANADPILPGINDDVLLKKAPARYGTELLTNMGDGTRGRREVAQLQVAQWLGGNVYPPDVDEWPNEPGIPTPFSQEHIMEILDILHEKDALAHEFDTECLRCLTDPSRAILIHTIFPEPHSGFSGYYHFKMWIKFNERWHAASLNVCVLNNDGCSTEIAAQKLLGTPVKWLIDLGVTYVGLPAVDYIYFGANLRPSMTTEEDEVYIPPPLMGGMDSPHHVRNFRKGIANLNKTIVMYSEKGDTGEEGLIKASMEYLTQLSHDRKLSRRYNLTEMVTLNNVFDQKGDAAYDLISQKTIKLLEKTFPNDIGTATCMKAMNYLSHPFKTHGFTNPFMVVEFMWTGLAVWELQEAYVKNLIKRMDLHCMAYQFREVNSLLAHFATNFCLVHFRHKKQTGSVQDWDDFGLQECNNDALEGLHSEERAGGMLRSNNDWSVNIEEHCRCFKKVQQIYDRRPLLEKNGMKLHHRHKSCRRAWSGEIKLGLPDDLVFDDIHYGQHSRIKVPDTYDEFCVLIEEARQRGYQRGCKLYEDMKLPHFQSSAAEQLKKHKLWREGVQDRPKAQHPAQKASWLVTGPVAKSKMPTTIITTTQIEQHCPKHVKAKAQTIASNSALSEGLDDASGDQGCHRESEKKKSKEYVDYNTPRFKEIMAAIRQELASFEAEESIDKKHLIAKGRTGGGDVTNKKAALKRTSVRALDGGTVTVRKLLRLYQLKDYHDRDRGKRFWVGRLRSFGVAVKEGHNTTVGTCLLVDWGGTKRFAVVRVMTIIDDDSKVWSCQLTVPSKNKTLRFNVELLG